MLETDILEEKIADPQLRKFARSENRRARSVLIKLDVLQPKIKLGRHVRGIGVRPYAVRPAAPAQSDLNDAMIKNFEGMLKELELEGKFLRTAGAFVVTATPQQLRSIAQADIVRTVIPNRVKRFPLSTNSSTA